MPTWICKLTEWKLPFQRKTACWLKNSLGFIFILYLSLKKIIEIRSYEIFYTSSLYIVWGKCDINWPEYSFRGRQEDFFKGENWLGFFWIDKTQAVPLFGFLEKFSLWVKCLC